ncbi:unnamed protein product [Cyclocybe aegerita]|uniref:Uncharacterized protein n=1 Tax=Cyclocybe aegerita TaxID=1973307 RepID=A0A8S0WEJ5_CYCAE|nr:unnamed protein product [Cyclocybe aegerita]
MNPLLSCAVDLDPLASSSTLKTTATVTIQLPLFLASPSASPPPLHLARSSGTRKKSSLKNFNMSTSSRRSSVKWSTPISQTKLIPSKSTTSSLVPWLLTSSEIEQKPAAAQSHVSDQQNYQYQPPETPLLYIGSSHSTSTGAASLDQSSSLSAFIESSWSISQHKGLHDPDRLLIDLENVSLSPAHQARNGSHLPLSGIFTRPRSKPKVENLAMVEEKARMNLLPLQRAMLPESRTIKRRPLKEVMLPVEVEQPIINTHSSPHPPPSDDPPLSCNIQTPTPPHSPECHSTIIQPSYTLDPSIPILNIQDIPTYPAAVYGSSQSSQPKKSPEKQNREVYTKRKASRSPSLERCPLKTIKADGNITSAPTPKTKDPRTDVFPRLDELGPALSQITPPPECPLPRGEDVAMTFEPPETVVPEDDSDDDSLFGDHEFEASTSKEVDRGRQLDRVVPTTGARWRRKSPKNTKIPKAKKVVPAPKPKTRLPVKHITVVEWKNDLERFHYLASGGKLDWRPAEELYKLLTTIDERKDDSYLTPENLMKTHLATAVKNFRHGGFEGKTRHLADQITKYWRQLCREA